MTDIRPMVLQFALVIALGTLAGCSGQPSAKEAAADQNAPAPQASHEATTAAGVQSVTGPVLETMDAANYTYVRVQGEAGEIWAASRQFQVSVGDRVVVPLEMPMENFHSESLKRDFPMLYFASAIVREGEQASPAMPSGHPPVGGTSSGPAAAQVTEVIAPAAGGTAIASVWAQRTALEGKAVTVRGKVVKFNGGILDRNWLHIQDGTGSASDGTHDLTITTTATARVGDIVTATGTVAADKDFGAGYTYKVIVLDATVTAK